MADMPYSAVTLPTLWKILWTLYNYQLTNVPSSGGDQSTIDQGTNGAHMPETTDEIMNSIKGYF